MKNSFLSNPLGENITRIRKSKNISQGELAEKIGVDRSSISHYESGSKSPSITNLEKIAEALNVSIDELLISKEQSANPFNVTQPPETIINFHQQSLMEKFSKFCAIEDVTDEDIEFLTKLRTLDENTKKIIADILNGK